MNRFFSLFSPAAVAVFILPSCGMAQMKVVSDIEENFAGIEEVMVKGGSLEVNYEGSDQERDVFLNAYLESNRSDGVEIIYKVEGKRLRVELRRESGGWGNVRTKGFISLTGPENMRLDITNSSGALFVSDVSSDKIELGISSGKIEAKRLSSDRINLRASSGKLEVEEVNGNLICKVSSGNGQITRVNGDVTVEASSGSYHISEVRGLVNASLSSGNLELQSIGELGSMRVSSGRIKATQAGLGGRTNFNGSSGTFIIQTDHDLKAYNFELSSSSGSLQVGNNETQKKLSIDNDAGRTVTGSISSGRISIQN